MFSWIILCFLISFAVAKYDEEQLSRRRCWSSGSGQPAKWWNEGEEIDRGEYWYECRNGQLAPKGCFSKDKKRLTINQKYNHDDYEITCQLGADGYLQFVYTACVKDNHHIAPGESWTDPDNHYYYSCQREGNYVRLKIQGCISHDGKSKVALGQMTNHGEFVYQCKQNGNGSVSMCSVGCLHDGKRYKVGEQWSENGFVFYCKLNGGKCTKRCVGCEYKNRRLYDGDRYKKDSTVYQCKIRRDAHSHTPVACISNDGDMDVERVIGCRWYVTKRDARIEQTCQVSRDKRATKINTIGCIFRYKGYDTVFLNPGTYTIWTPPSGRNSIGLSCKMTSDSMAQLDEFDPRTEKSKTYGLTFESPKGK